MNIHIAPFQVYGLASASNSDGDGNWILRISRPKNFQFFCHKGRWYKSVPKQIKRTLHSIPKFDTIIKATAIMTLKDSYSKSKGDHFKRHICMYPKIFFSGKHHCLSVKSQDCHTYFAVKTGVSLNLSAKRTVGKEGEVHVLVMIIAALDSRGQ